MHFTIYERTNPNICTYIRICFISIVYVLYRAGMVIIKPDALERPSSLPGHIMDLFGSTGLHLVGCRVFSFSVRQAREFYGFLEDVFVDKLRPKLEARIKRALDKVRISKQTKHNTTHS